MSLTQTNKMSLPADALTPTVQTQLLRTGGRDKRNENCREKTDEIRRENGKKPNRKEKAGGREDERRDELFMCCPRRGQLWPTDTR